MGFSVLHFKVHHSSIRGKPRTLFISSIYDWRGESLQQRRTFDFLTFHSSRTITSMFGELMCPTELNIVNWSNNFILISSNMAQTFLSIRAELKGFCAYLSHICGIIVTLTLVCLASLHSLSRCTFFFPFSLNFKVWIFFNSSRNAIHRQANLAQHRRVHTETFQLPNRDCACIPLSNCFYSWNNLIYINIYIYVHTYKHSVTFISTFEPFVFQYCWKLYSLFGVLSSSCRFCVFYSHGFNKDKLPNA